MIDRIVRKSDKIATKAIQHTCVLIVCAML